MTLRQLPLFCMLLDLPPTQVTRKVPPKCALNDTREIETRPKNQKSKHWVNIIQKAQCQSKLSNMATVRHIFVLLLSIMILQSAVGRELQSSFIDEPLKSTRSSLKVSANALPVATHCH
jgi:hypothetical protein